MNNMVLQGGILLIFLLDSTLVLDQILSERSAFKVKEWVFCPIVLYRASPR